MSSNSPLRRFKRSMIIDYEKWHDGIGYDLEALREANAAERESIEEILVNRRPLGWRDVEALALVDTKRTREVLRNVISDTDPEVRMAIIRYAPNLITEEERISSTVYALRTAKLFRGLSQTLDQVAEFHPKEVVSELMQGVLAREGEAAILFAAMLFFIYGKSDEPFDMKHRSFFLRFNTEDKEERKRSFLELCEIIGVKPE